VFFGVACTVRRRLVFFQVPSLVARSVSAS
jgi:hypothetical protein